MRRFKPESTWPRGENYVFYQFGTLNGAGVQIWVWVDYQNLSGVIAGPTIGYAVKYVLEPQVPRSYSQQPPLVFVSGDVISRL